MRLRKVKSARGEETKEALGVQLRYIEQGEPAARGLVPDGIVL